MAPTIVSSPESTPLLLSKRPSLEAVLEARDEAQFRLLALFLPDATLAEVDALTSVEMLSFENEPLTTSIWKLIIARRSVLDPQGTLSLIRDGDPIEPWMVGWCLRAWSTADPMGALQEAEKHPEEHLKSVIDAVIAHDFNEAIALSQRYPEEYYVGKQVMKAWAAEDLEGALAHIDALPSNEQIARFAFIMESLANADARKALSFVLKQDDPDRREKALFTVLPEFIKEAPEEAESHIRTLPDGKARFQLLKKLAASHAKRDPAGAMQWAKELRDPGERRAGIAQAFQAMKFDSMEDRIAMVRRLGMSEAIPNPREISRTKRSSGGSLSYMGGSDLNQSVNRSITTLARDDPQAALRFAAEFPPMIGADDFHPKDDFLKGISKAWVKGEHRDSFLGMLETIPDTSSRSSMLRAAIDDAPLETYEWLSTEISAAPEESFDSEMIETVARGWLKEDALTASEWIGQLPASPKKDRAVETMLHTLTSSDQPDFEAAFAWSQVIGDESKREEHIKRIYPRWETQNPALAEEALTSANISDAVRAKLLAKEAQP